MRRLTTYTPAPPLTPADLTRRLAGLRAQLLTANGEWAEQITNDIAALERMLTARRQQHEQA